MQFLQTRCWLLVILISSVFLASSCKPRVKNIKSPNHYNFSRRQQFKLDVGIREISGLCWDSKNDVYVAINDEYGKLYFLYEDKKSIIPEPVKFADRGDYEDVTVVAGVPYVLRSDGQITRLLKDTAGGYLQKSEKINLPGNNDFESLYYDVERKALIMLCKNCESDDAKTVSAYAYYPDSSIGFVTKPVFTINTGDVAKLANKKTAKLQPSAAAIHPILHKLYIVSSASHQLVVTDLNGKVDSVYELGKKLFPQPEGLCFRKDGTMLIANEGTTGNGTILQFAFDSTSDNTKPYNYARPDEKMELGKHLHEISGMSWLPKENLILAENDEKGQIFTLDFINKKDEIGKVKFGGKGDYEDIVHTDSAIYMLIATGGVVKVDTKDSAMTTTEYYLPGEKNEFETLYLEKDGKSLIMLCKQCQGEKKEGVRVAYRFDLATNSFDPSPAFTISIEDIQAKLGDDKAEFKPSAAGINPVDGKLYIVASVGKLLVVADRISGKVERVFKLDPVLYNQPEGLTFAPNGDLYISNEGGEEIATILKFIYRR